jgi:hypothetical protein
MMIELKKKMTARFGGYSLGEIKVYNSMKAYSSLKSQQRCCMKHFPKPLSFPALLTMLGPSEEGAKSAEMHHS